ncbi:MAG: RidA family protein [Chloroflexi bacterium]|nr:RidA family protein [Chloroflexota bacterium]
MEIEARLDQLGLTLPDLPTPVGAYLLSRQSGDLLFLSGTTCYTPGGLLYKGRLGAELDLQQGYAAARQTMLNLLGVVKAVLGDLDRVECVVKLNGYVNSTLDFDRQPEVINGASDLLEQLFGERGRHARTSIGVNILPGNIPVEIEMVLQVRNRTGGV